MLTSLKNKIKLNLKKSLTIPIKFIKLIKLTIFCKYIFLVNIISYWRQNGY